MDVTRRCSESALVRQTMVESHKMYNVEWSQMIKLICCS